MYGISPYGLAPNGIAATHETDGGSGSPVRAIIMVAGSLQQITDVQVGTGQKPLVLLDGSIKVQATVEGLPIVYEAGYLRTLAAGETLLI